LVVLRYLETQPSDPIAAAVLSSPWLAAATPMPLAKRLIVRLLADLWPAGRVTVGPDATLLSRDASIGAAYDADPTVHRVMTPGAWREIQWAQRVIPVDAYRIECPLLFLLAGGDRISDAERARGFAEAQHGPVEVRWYPDMCHELLNDPEGERVVGDVVAFLGQTVSGQ
ncbi:MAG: serine aminopeptidase domain-containing protein, partial [Gemmatimonadales bacterium]